MELYGLIFDLDGVIADTEEVNAKASIKMFEGLFGIKGLQRKDFEAGLGRGAEAYVRAAGDLHGFEMTSEQLDQATKVRHGNFMKILDTEPLPPFPGVLELMEAAKNQPKFRVGIATSSSREKSRAVLDSARIPYRDMTYINGDNVTEKKPSPEIFMVCAARMGVVPQRCVVIEDAPDGVSAAKAAGSKCIAVTNSVSADRLAHADKVVESLEEVDTEQIIRLVEGK